MSTHSRTISCAQESERTSIGLDTAARMNLMWVAQ